MSESSDNPYETSTLSLSEDAERSKVTHTIQLYPLWIWWPCAIVGAFVVAPSDPISALMILAVAVLGFLVGANLASSLPVIAKIAPLILLLFPIAWFTEGLLAGHIAWAVVELLYWLASGAIGFWASLWMGHARRRILIAFMLGLVASFACPPPLFPGLFGWPILFTYWAKRSLLASEPPIWDGI